MMIELAAALRFSSSKHTHITAHLPLTLSREDNIVYEMPLVISCRVLSLCTCGSSPQKQYTVPHLMSTKTSNASSTSFNPMPATYSIPLITTHHPILTLRSPNTSSPLPHLYPPHHSSSPFPLFIPFTPSLSPSYSPSPPLLSPAPKWR